MSHGPHIPLINTVFSYVYACATVEVSHIWQSQLSKHFFSQKATKVLKQAARAIP